MYPTLYHAVSDLFGVEIEFLKVVQSFGFFVAIAFLSASYFFAIELKRKEREGLMPPVKTKILLGEKASVADLILSAIIGFILGYKLLDVALNFSEFAKDTQQFLLSLRGNLPGGLLGAALSAYLKYREKEKHKLPQPKWEEQLVHPYEHVGNMTLIAAVAGILGAKIFHNLENLDEFMEDPIDALLSFSGLTMYGGLIVGAAAVIYYARKHKLNAWHLIDACAPGLMLAYAVGRIGCQVAGDGDWGIANPAPQPGWLSFLPEWTWAFSYPHNVNDIGILIPGCEGRYCHELVPPVFPTPFYETVMCGILFLILWAIRKRITVPGMLFCIYLSFNGIERFLIESIRVNTTYHLFGKEITQAQIISTLLFFTGIMGIWILNKRHKKQTPTTKINSTT